MVRTVRLLGRFGSADPACLLGTVSQFDNTFDPDGEAG